MFGKSTSHSNIDGFVVRRRKNSGNQKLGADSTPIPEQFLDSPRLQSRKESAQTLAPSSGIAGTYQVPRNTANGRDDELSELLSQLPGEGQDEAKAKKHRLRLSKKALKRLFLLLGTLLLLAGGFVAVKFIIASGRVFDGNLFSALLSDGKELRKDQYGRVNILMFGTAGENIDHDGSDLTDSIMIASINPTDKTGFLISVPRDLWVKYGQACSAGYEGKINVVYQCGKGDNGTTADGASLLQQTVESTFGVDIQYYAAVNFAALKQAVDAVDGITVEIKSDDPRGILDRNFDWKCGYRCHYVKWPNGPAKLNGEQALALARARNAAGGYGLDGGNFDREQYQQKILIALKEKASSAGVLANPVAVTNLLDSLGDNVRTNFDAGEIKTVVQLAQEVDAKQLKRVSLIDEEDPLVTTGNVSGQSIVRPVAGLYDYSEIRSVVRAHLSGDASLLENATVDVLNGSGVPGAAQKQADELELQGYSINEIGNAPEGSYKGVKLYDLSDGKMPGTKGRLQQQLGISSVGNSSTLPSGVMSDADFVIIIGTNGSN